MTIFDKIKRKLAGWIKCDKSHQERTQEEAETFVRNAVGKNAAQQRERIKKRRGTKGTLRMVSITVTAMLAASVVMSDSVIASAADESFAEFMEKEWKTSVELDYLTMHVAVKDYRSMGLTKPEVTLGDISYEEIEEEVNDAKRSLDKLHQFDYEELNETEQHDYLVYEDYLECVIGMEENPNMVEAFRPITGSLTQVKEVLEDFAMYSEEDIEDYLTLLADYPRLIDQMIELTSQQAAKGYLMDDNSVDIAIDEINDFVSAGSKNEMIAVFDNSIDNFDWLDDDAKAEYKKRSSDIVTGKVIPAYKKAGKALKKLRGSRKYGDAVCDYPDGKEYYTWLARYYCSTDETLEEKFDFLTESIEETMVYFTDLIRKNPSFRDPENIENLDTLDEVIEYLQDNMEGFPQGPSVKYKLAYLDESVAESAMAYYVQSPVDDITENVIHVNKKAIKDINALYYTLAHEGFPGHLYQMTWYQNSGASNLRHDVAMMGYQEGWANYVERIMLKRSELDPVSAEYIACDEFTSYMINAGADLAVNGLGYNVKELGKWLDKVGLDRSYARDMYEYVTENPGLLLPYGYGQAKFWDLNGRARAALGKDFDLEEYHLQILTNGPRQFEIVEQDLKEYVESKGATLPDEVEMFADESIVPDTKDTVDEPSSGNTSDTDQEEVPTETNALNWAIVAVAGLVVIAILALIFLSRRKRRSPAEADLKEDIVTEEDTEYNDNSDRPIF